MKKKRISLRMIKEIMSVKDLKNTLGGSVGGCGNVYRCCCGMGQTNDCWDAEAGSIDEALDRVNDICPGGIGGCYD